MHGLQPAAVRPDPPAMRWLVGTELRNYRKKAGLRLTDAAAFTDVSGQMIGHYENGLYSPPLDVLADLMRGYQAPEEDIERIASLISRSNLNSTWLSTWSDVLPDWLRTYVGLEGLAAHVATYCPMVLPGLVQTEPYSKGVTAGHSSVRPDQAGRIIRLRMERQCRLFADHAPLRLTALIEESVLDRPIGDDSTMRGQLEHLVSLAERDNVELLVLPTSVGRHDGLEGRFDVLHFPRAQSIGYIEFPDGAIYVQEPGRVAAYTTRAKTLRELALPQRASVRAIEARLRASN